MNVKKNAKRNIFFGLFSKFILIISPFIVKMVIQNVLGAEFLGLNSLFNSILQVLTLSELGFSAAIVYNMYKPIAENDNKKINALLKVYKKVYKIIGIVIGIIGILILPFLDFFINGSSPKNINIKVIYIIQLLNTILSYLLFAYRQSLLVAHQREDVISLSNLCINLLMQVIQIIIIFVFKNYYLYIFCMPIFTILYNLWIYFITKKMFPYNKCEGNLDDDSIHSIKKLVAGSFIQKFCSITRNSLDSICISTFFGLVITAIYSNYFSIFNGITSLMTIIGSSLAAGVGNHVIKRSVDVNYKELLKLENIYLIISGICCSYLLCLSQPFMKLWMGSEMLFNDKVVMLMCFYFYSLKIGDMRSLYSNANGLWWKMKYKAICETIANISLNILLGKLLGIYGIILSTIISLLLFNFIWGVNIIFNEYFGKEKKKKYFFHHLKFFSINLIFCCLSYLVCSLIKNTSIFSELIIRGGIVTLFSLFFIIIIYKMSNEFRISLFLLKKENNK